ncbi:hypothetical protein [Verrucomicrobium spinosum]|uniref:hypothetical protein n=1 Tax=Verrucomicrobium spinosum TaxID=2736 RepID=UPI00155D92BD|nr:hypothetical protein [Verrucomicrobium spinosum]
MGRLELNSYSQTVDSLVFTSNTATANEVVIGKGQKLSITGTTGLDLGTGASNAAMTTNATFSGGGAWSSATRAPIWSWALPMPQSTPAPPMRPRSISRHWDRLWRM